MKLRRAFVLALPAFPLFALACASLEPAGEDGRDDGLVPAEADEDMKAAATSLAVLRARDHVRANPGQIPQDEDYEFQMRDAIVDPNGTEQVRFDRTYKKIRVLGGDMVVHGSKTAAFRGVELAFAGAMRPNMQANVSGAAAADIAQRFLSGHGPCDQPRARGLHPRRCLPLGL